jgi:RNA polymerase sigma-70 factor, ECF subfamily
MEDSVWTIVCEAWPEPSPTIRDEFEAFLAQKTAQAPESSPPSLDRVRTLFLTFLCSRGDAQAIRVFRQRFAPTLEGVRKRFGARAPSADELQADVEHHLFAPRPARSERSEGGGGSEPRILGFDGQSELQSWLKVVVVRLMLNRLEMQKHEDPFQERMFDGMIASSIQTPEALFGREQAKGQFRLAFTRAVSALRARDRQMLRLAFAEGLTIDDLGALYGIHRTTAFRQLQKASDTLAATLRANLRNMLHMTEAEYEHWCTTLRSSLELSLHRYFAADETP